MSGRGLVEHGDCLAVLPTLDAESVDAIVCDPPYGLGFMGVKWDTYGDGKGRAPSGKPAFDHVGGNHNPTCSADAARTRRKENQRFEEAAFAWAAEMLRVAKPGAHLVAFGGTRTFHRLACAIEDAGWEIRDCLSWLHGQGFPKSLDVSKALDKAAGAEGERIRGVRSGVVASTYAQDAWSKEFKDSVLSPEPITDEAARWRGWGTALKPAWEPIILACKPLAGTVAANVAAHGTGALNIGACRLGTGGDKTSGGCKGMTALHDGGIKARAQVDQSVGRWPANVVLDEDAAALLDAQSGVSVSGTERRPRGTGGLWSGRSNHPCGPQYGDVGGASRFFYCAKASRRERDAGLEGMPEKRGEYRPHDDANENTLVTRLHGSRKALNHHPTVKPLALMRWLCRLVTPPGGLVLDPFAGSGSTGCAAVLEGFRFVGIEREAEYVEIARRRVAYWEAQYQPGLVDAGDSTDAA